MDENVLNNITEERDVYGSSQTCHFENHSAITLTMKDGSRRGYKRPHSTLIQLIIQTKNYRLIFLTTVSWCLKY